MDSWSSIYFRPRKKKKTNTSKKHPPKNSKQQAGENVYSFRFSQYVDEALNLRSQCFDAIPVFTSLATRDVITH